MKAWKPENWHELGREQRQSLRRKHRRSVWGPLQEKARGWIIDAAKLAGYVGDEKHEWVVDLLLDVVRRALPFWARPVVRTWWFRCLIDGLVFDTFQAMRKVGAV